MLSKSIKMLIFKKIYQIQKLNLFSNKTLKYIEEASHSNIWEIVIMINNIIMLQLLTNSHFKCIQFTFNITILINNKNIKGSV